MDTEPTADPAKQAKKPDAETDEPMTSSRPAAGKNTALSLAEMEGATPRPVHGEDRIILRTHAF